jgi:drug/metabolite transporter (DMT)-like permease
MTWVGLAVLSYLIFAVVNLGDKFVVDKLLKSSKAYAFIVALLSSVIFILAPWFLEWPGIFLFLINLLSGSFFVFALWAMYEALKRGEASRVVVVIGSIVPIFSVAFSTIFLKENFSLNQWIGFSFLLLGMTVMSFVVSKKKKAGVFIKKIFSLFYKEKPKKWLFLALIAAFFYALFFVGTKYAYENQSFLSSFIWIRGGGLLVVAFFLIDGTARKEILKSIKEKPKRSFKKSRWFIVFNQILGSLAFLFQNYAIFLGPVAIINAMQGVQYAFLFIFGIFFSFFFPKILREDMSKKALVKKILAIIFVGIGLYFIAI